MLLRVLGPPYYSLLRALERNNEQAPRAYVERGPRVWVELGYTHSLVDAIKAPDGQLLLLRPERDWLFLDDAKFQDIYELLDFPLPAGPVAWTATPPVERLKVPLRLAPSSGTLPAELWVIRRDAYEQIDTLVREADDQLVARLAFAVSESEGQLTVIVRVRPSKQAPPSLALDAEGFRPYLKMPNLFMPVGRRLQPPLRRDIVRRLLADDPDKIVWLYPQGVDQFLPESLPDAAFRPLADWVEYVLDREHRDIATWIASARFDFAGFICRDDAPPERPAPRGQRKELARKSMLAGAADPEGPVAAPTARSPAADEEALQLPEIQPSELQKRLGELEEQFLASDRPLDDPERQALWPAMGELHAALPDHQADAAVCWLNALWEQESPPADWLARWARCETPANQRVTGAVLDRYFDMAEPRDADTRALVASLLLAAWGDDPAGQQALLDRLPRIQRFLEQHESKLGVRAVWLAWMGLAQLASADVLGLARTRDRLLERLLREGLSTERDLPSFLRVTGSQSAERFRAVRERVVRLAELARGWIGRCTIESSSLAPVASQEHTQAYGDLLFSFGLARLGETTHSRQLLARASDFLGTKDEVHCFLLKAFTYRIEQALAGKPHAGTLPAELCGELDRMSAKDKASFYAYKVDRLRNALRILEPEEKFDVYEKDHERRGYRRERDDPLECRLDALSRSMDRHEVEAGIAELLEAQQKPSAALRVIAAGLQLVPRLGEQFAGKLLAALVRFRAKIPPLLDSKELEARFGLFERAIFFAAHYDFRDVVQPLMRMVAEQLEPRAGVVVEHGLDALIQQCFRSLRKLGVRDEIKHLLSLLNDFLTHGRTLAEMQAAQPALWPKTLQKLVQLAGALYYFGRDAEGKPILDQARALLFDSTQGVDPVFRANLAAAYATALAQAPVQTALDGLEELFQRTVPILDRMITTGTHYSLLQLRVIEAVVLAVSSDDFAVGQNVRRWLDEDEYLVRRRIHRDLRASLAQAGL